MLSKILRTAAPVALMGINSRNIRLLKREQARGLPALQRLEIATMGMPYLRPRDRLCIPHPRGARSLKGVLMNAARVECPLLGEPDSWGEPLFLGLSNKKLRLGANQPSVKILSLPAAARGLPAPDVIL